MEREVKQVIEDIGKVYAALADEDSKAIYINRLNYLITKNFQYLERCIKRNHPNIKYGGVPYIMRDIPPERHFFLYGAGKNAEMFMEYLCDNKMFCGFLDLDKRKQDEGFHGFKVFSPDVFFQESQDAFIVISTLAFAEEVVEFLVAKGVEENRIISMKDYFPLETEDLYFGMDFIKFEEKEVFVDAGCNNLDTTVQFSKICPNLKKVFAFEPDPVTLSVCRKRKKSEQLECVSIYPYATWSKKQKLMFSATGDYSSHLTSKGEIVVETITIDEIVMDENVTFIKMDVEGAELQSLIGAKNTIIKNRPKLAICLYHKLEDMLTLPLYIKSIVPEYKLYVRHHGNADTETVLYAVM